MELALYQRYSQYKLIKNLCIAFAVAILASMLITVTVNAWVGLGGMLSEKLIGSATGTSDLYISTDGEATPFVIGMGATVTTNVATNAIPSSIELNGTVNSLNGMPQATCYFEWGYNSNCTEGTTATTVLTSPGTFQLPLAGFDETQEIFFRAVTDTDGTLKGSVRSVIVSTAQSSNLLRVILPLIIACAVILYIIRANTASEFTTVVVVGLVVYILASVIISIMI